MSKYNSIRSFQYLLYLIIFIISGCAEKATTHAFINELPPSPIEVNYLALEEPIAEEQNFIDQQIQAIKSEPVNYKTVWDRLLALYAFPEIDNERIDHELQKYLKHPEYLTKIQQRAEPYLYFILDEIEAKNIPGELALLPVVESAFQSHALSKSKASGLWQFMPATGRLFGLKQNWWYDGRRDVVTSTKAATTYLKQLNQLYDGDWFLTLAAYNAGKGTLRKVIRKNREKDLASDYWSLPLREETMNYVPRLLAIAKIFANSEQYNIPLLNIPNTAHFDIVNIESQINLSLAAEMANTSVAEFHSLNPGFKRESTDPDGPFHLLVHSDKAELFKEKLSHTQVKDRMNWVRHRINPGENLGMIAKKYHTSVTALRQSNRLVNDNIRAGKFILIPSSVQPDSIQQKHYIVKKGDTFWDIARQFSVRSKDIADWNKISLSKILQPGQKLIIREG